MANWKQAWDVLRNGLPIAPEPEPKAEPEIKYIVGEHVTVYAATVPDYSPVVGHYNPYREYEKVLSYHLTCAEAFAAGGTKAEAKTAYRSGGDYYLVSQASRIEIAPKPKKSKGAK